MDPGWFLALQIVLRGSDAQPSTFRQLQPEEKCIGECPTPSDLGSIAVRFGSYASTSTQQWQFGSTDAYLEPILP